MVGVYGFCLAWCLCVCGMFKLFIALGGPAGALAFSSPPSRIAGRVVALRSGRAPWRGPPAAPVGVGGLCQRITVQARV